MLNIRIIPALLLSNIGLVKGAKFSKHRYIGDPINTVKIFNDKEVDELIFFDINATNESRSPNFELLSDIASQAFMPFGYGGGLHNVKQVERLFKIGAEKAIINSAAVYNKQLVRDASSIAGSQSIVVSIDVKKNILGKHIVYTHSGTIKSGFDVVDYSRRIEDAGAGEIIICSIDREGTNLGFDKELIKSVSESVNIPVVASGGAGKISHFKQAVDLGASAISAGNIFIFHGKHRAVLITYPEREDLKRLFKD